ncbi:hypothetical protein JCGZ_22085 [Jatropha curcas]|uniref:Uncharacterized protein n=1 Tax=Jatropha curcas TaxID=180498 RepID=A0A067K424_JATCU|nr:hypothetical protein JCGZ_22085 [Jatropha curcas]
MQGWSLPSIILALGAAALSYLYYGIDLCIRGALLKIGYRRVIEIVKYLWGQINEFPDFIQVAIAYQQRRLLLLGLFYDKSIKLECDIVVVHKGSATTDHLFGFIPGAYAIFLRTQLLVQVPHLAEFDPFLEAEEVYRDQGTALAWLSLMSFIMFQALS